MAVLADCLYVIYENAIAHTPYETPKGASAHHYDR